MIQFEKDKAKANRAGRSKALARVPRESREEANRESPAPEERESRIANLRTDAAAVDPASLEEEEGPLSTVPVRLSRKDLEWVDAARGDRPRAAFLRALVRAGRKAGAVG